MQEDRILNKCKKLVEKYAEIVNQITNLWI